MEIPVVDFSCFTGSEAGSELRSKLVEDVHKAFSTVGFLYITNHGLKQLNNVQECAESLFALPVEVKQKYARLDSSNNHGWVALKREQLNENRPTDYKESYNITPQLATSWPDEDVPGFKDKVMEFYQECYQLANQVLSVMAEGLNLEDKEYFAKCHNDHVKENATTLRLLHYPAIPDNIEIEPNQIRCGEHSDYGSITLLFQDDVGGLQVCSRDGTWVDATPIPETVVINLGDLMQRWTSDKLVATKHRVIIPQESKSKVRQSFAMFVHPDDDTMVECLDGSGKYPPISSLDYLKMRLDATYPY